MKTLPSRLSAAKTCWIIGTAILAGVLVLALDSVFNVGSVAAAGHSWQWPTGAPARVKAPFDAPAKPWLAGHRGVDLAAGYGTTIRAAGAGTVTFAGVIAGRGVVTVTHGALRTTYEPVAAIVTAGTSVSAGQPIGTIGTGGHCDSHCLHWGLIRGETYLNPLLLLGLSPPVLKTLASRQAGLSDRSTSNLQPRFVDPPISQIGRQVSPNSVPTSQEPSAAFTALAGGSAIAIGVVAGAAEARRRRRRHG